MTGPILVCRDVSVRHEPDAAPVLSSVSFSMKMGERVALVGLNGSGKTSLLLSLVGLVPHQGEIIVCGTQLDRGTASEVRGRVGFLFNTPEDQLLFPEVIEDAAFGLVRAGIGAAEALETAGRALEKLGVGHLAKSPLHHLSHGQKQRVALAGAIVANPPLLLLDEPTAGLDPPGKRRLTDILVDLDAAALVATHDLDLADRLCSRVLMLDQGTIALDSPGTGEIRLKWKMDGRL
jgi:cobalt/nickel transport system ATP-binding protein